MKNKLFNNIFVKQIEPIRPVNGENKVTYPYFWDPLDLAGPGSWIRLAYTILK